MLKELNICSCSHYSNSASVCHGHYISAASFLFLPPEVTFIASTFSETPVWHSQTEESINSGYRGKHFLQIIIFNIYLYRGGWLNNMIPSKLCMILTVCMTPFPLLPDALRVNQFIHSTSGVPLGKLLTILHLGTWISNLGVTNLLSEPLGYHWSKQQLFFFYEIGVERSLQALPPFPHWWFQCELGNMEMLRWD